MTVADAIQVQADTCYLDSNRRVIAERYLDHYALHNDEPMSAEAVERAISVAEANAPTTQEAARRIAEMRNGPTYCYLAFYGLDGRGLFLKVGMTSHPEKRLHDFACGNPLDCLWTFAARLPTRPQAYRVEQAILRHLADQKRRGEWLAVSCDADGAWAIAREMSELAESIFPNEAGAFSVLTYRDGREAA